jgi:very-short-patch-repair endonuclease
LVRLAIVEVGLPEPEVNVNIVDSNGMFLGRGDLVYRRWRVIVEYDGDQHRTDTRQFDHDVRRLEDFAADGWRVVRIVGRSFFTDRRACVARVARALLDSGWRA